MTICGTLCQPPGWLGLRVRLGLKTFYYKMRRFPCIGNPTITLSIINCQLRGSLSGLHATLNYSVLVNVRDLYSVVSVASTYGNGAKAMLYSSLILFSIGKYWCFFYFISVVLIKKNLMHFRSF